MLNNPFLAKVNHAMRSFNTSSKELYNMEGFWKDHPQPAYYYLKDSDQYGKYPGFTYSGKSSELNSALKEFGSRKMSDTFYEKFLGMIVLGPYNYSHKKFPSLRKLAVNASPEQWVRAESDLSKAILMNPHFEVYLRKNEHILGDVAMKYIDSAASSERTVYAKFFTARDNGGNISKEVLALATTPEEKLVAAYAKNPFTVLKVGTEKVERLKNEVLGKFIELRPDIAYSQIPIECFLAANNEVKEKYLESLDNSKKSIISSAALWEREDSLSLIDKKVNELRYKPSEALPKLFLELRKFEPKMLKKIMTRASELEASVKNYCAEYLYKADGAFNEDFKAVYKGTNFVKPFMVAVKGYPSHLQFDALFAGENVSKEALLKDVAGNAKANDITVALAKDPDFWVTYINNFKKNATLQNEIVKKMSRVEDAEGARKVFNALVSSNQPVATAYILSLSLPGVSKEDVRVAVEGKIEKSVKNFEVLPPLLIFKLSERAKALAVEGYFTQGDTDKAFDVMLQTEFMSKDSESVKHAAITEFLGEIQPVLDEKIEPKQHKSPKP